MNTKRIATVFAVLAATTVSFSAFAASMDANARAYERAAAEQAQYEYTPVNSAPVAQASYVAMPPRPNYSPLPAVPYTAGDMSQQMPVSKEIRRSNLRGSTNNSCRHANHGSNSKP